jgi:hypothetical protein
MKYRYRLWRTWNTDIKKKPITWLMLNPSTADENILDPTVRRCLGYSIQWGYGRMDVINIFALRSTDPKRLYSCHDPVGIDNNRSIIQTAKESDRVIAAWGNHGLYKDRYKEVLALFNEINTPLYCLKTSKYDQPVHPLYQRSDIIPIIYSPKATS